MLITTTTTTIGGPIRISAELAPELWLCEATQMHLGMQI